MQPVCDIFGAAKAGWQVLYPGNFGFIYTENFISHCCRIEHQAKATVVASEKSPKLQVDVQFLTHWTVCMLHVWLVKYDV